MPCIAITTYEDPLTCACCGQSLGAQECTLHLSGIAEVEMVGMSQFLRPVELSGEVRLLLCNFCLAAIHGGKRLTLQGRF
jgi:hypothetical protein